MIYLLLAILLPSVATATSEGIIPLGLPGGGTSKAIIASGPGQIAYQNADNLEAIETGKDGQVLIPCKNYSSWKWVDLDKAKEAMEKCK